MIALYAAEERTVEVLEEARTWQAAGLVSEEQFAAVGEIYRPALVRVNLFFRLLLAGFALVATVSAAALVGVTLHVGDFVGSLLLLAAAAGSAYLADRWLIAGRRFYRCGAEEALLAAGVGFASAGAALLARRAGIPWEATEFVGRAVVLGGTAAVALRYGNPLFALAAAWSLVALPLSVRFLDPPAARLVLVLLATPSAAWAGRLLSRGRRGDAVLLPGDRRCLETVRWVCLAAVYVAANSYVDQLPSFGHLYSPTPAAAPPLWRTWLCGALTAGLPAAWLALGVRRRDRGLLWLGALSALASLLTLKYFVHLGHLAQELTAAGAVLAATAAALMRWLGAGPDRERGGFTAERVLDPRLYGFDAEALAAMQPLAPGSAPAQGGFRPGGGGFGGGGASGGFG